MTIFSLSHCRVKSAERAGRKLGKRTYNVAVVIHVALDDTFHLLDGRRFYDEQGAIHLRLTTGENRFGCESWSDNLCSVTEARQYL